MTSSSVTLQSAQSGVSATQAGSHPNVTYAIAGDAAGADSTNDDLKSLTIELPPGLLGNPQAPASKCTDAQLASQTCPSASQIGSFDTVQRVHYATFFGSKLYKNVSGTGKAYIMQPATVNDPISIGFVVNPVDYFPFFMKQKVTGVVGVKAGTEGTYGATVTLEGFPTQLRLKSTGVWWNSTIASINSKINSKAPNGKYFNFLPTRCDSPSTTTFKSVSNNVSTPVVRTSSFTATGCSSVPFNPTGSATPTDLLAGASSAWSATFGVPTADANIQNSHVKTIQTDLPVGTNLDFPALGSVDTCPVTDINLDVCDTTHPNSKVGTATANVPFLSAQMNGDIYVVQNSTNFMFGYVLRGPNQIKAMLLIRMSVISASGGDFVRAISQPLPGTLPQAPWTSATLNFTKKFLTNPACVPGTSPMTGTVTNTITPWSGTAPVVRTNTVTYTRPSGGCGVTNTPPTVSISAPVNNSTTSAATTNLVFSVSDAETPSGPFTCNYTSGQSITLNPGVNNITVNCTDPGGAAGSATVTVTRTMPPDVLISSPSTNPMNTNLASVNVAFTVGGATSIPAGTTCSVTNTTTGTGGATTSATSNPVALQLGSNTIRVSCTNAAGTTNVDTVVVRGNAPTVAITSPSTNPAYVTTSSVNIAYSVDGGSSIPAGTTCTVANQSTGTSNSSTSTSTNNVNLQIGLNNILVTCSNAFGSNGAGVAVNRGSIPVVVITSPATDPFSTAASSFDIAYTVNGSTTVPAGTTCTVTNLTTSSVGDPVALQVGSNNINVGCTNAFGTGSDTTVIVRGTPPTVTITDPATDPFNTTAATYDIGYSATAGSTCSVANTTTGATGDPIALQVGTNLITVTCTNAFGTGTDTTTINRGGPPTVLITSPTPDPLNTTVSSINVQFTVNGASSIPAGTTCTVNGTATTSTTTNNVAIVAGSNTITASCTNAFGTGSDTTVVIQGTPASVTITDPATDPFNTTAATYDIGYSSTAGSTCTVTNTTTGATGDPVALQVGTNLITVTCANVFGSGSDTTTINRGGPPTVLITAPTPDPTNTTAASVNVAFTVNGASSIPAGTTCTVNGTATTSTTSNTVAVAIGSNTITASCTNAFGTGSDTTVVIRGTAPTVSITDPATDPLNTTATSYDIAYSSTGTAPVTCVVTNTSTGATGDPVSLQVGTNNISVTCTNAFGSASDTTTINRGGPPTVLITAPTPDPLNTAATSINVAFSVNGSASIPAGTTCTVNGTATTSVTTNNVALSLGSNTITASCTNAFGTGSDTTVVVRGTAPTVSITDPATDPLSTAASSYDIAYTSTGTAPVTCTVVNTSTGVTGDPVALQNGANVITVTCTNAFGSASDTTTINRGTGPAVVITAPTPDPLNTTATSINTAFTVNGSASIPAGTTCTVNGTATTSATTNNVALAVGSNTITVSCTSSFGTGSDTTVVVRGTAPTVSITDPSTDPLNTTATSYDIAYTSTGTAPVTCTVLNVTTGATADPVALNLGTNLVRVTCTNAFGTAQDETTINRGVAPDVIRTQPVTVPANVTTATTNVAYTLNGATTIPAGTSCTVANTTTGVSNPSTNPTTNSVSLNVGANVITITCTSAFGSDTETFTINRGSVPTVLITTPSTDPSSSPSSPINVVYSVNGAGSIPAGTTCEIRNNSGAFSPTTTPGTNSVTLTGGANVIEVRCTNAFGSGSDTTTVNFGNVPAVVITAPLPNPSFTTNASTNVTFTVNGTSSIPAGTTCTVNGTGTTSTSTNNVALAVGANTITVACTNSFGTGQDQVVVNRGSVPTVVITAPAADPAFVTTSPVNVAFTVNGGTSIPAGTTCTVNGGSTTSTTTNSVNLVAGTNNVTVACTNPYGTGQDVNVVNLGNAPTVSITSPATDPFNTTATTYDLVYSTTGTAPVTCTVTNTSTGATGDPVALQVGTNNITVNCTNAYGSASDSTVINRGTAPTVSITDPATDPLNTSAATYDIVYTSGGTAPVTCTVVNTSTGVTGDPVALQNGANVITVTCTNAFGSASDTTTINRGTGPAVVITAPTPDPLNTTATSINTAFTVNGSASIPAGTSCTVNGTATSSATTNNVALALGSNTITVSCTSSFGTGSDTTVVVRGTAPTVSITDPSADPLNTTATSYDIAYTSGGTAPVTCTVLNVTTGVTGDPVSLQTGTNLVRVTCTNAFGTAQDETTINRGTAPTVLITAPTPDPLNTTATSINTAFTVNGSASIPAGTTCTVNGTATTSATTNNVALAVGSNTITASCTNAFGTGSDTTVVVRGTAPTVSITSPATDPLNTTAATFDMVYTTTGTAPVTCTVTNTSTGQTGDPVNLQVGTNNISVTCTNAFGSATDTTVINRGSAPTVSITDPATDPLNTTAATYDIAYTSTGTAPVTCTVLNVTTGVTGDPVSLNAGGNLIRVTCTNAFGTAQDETTINRGTGPVVLITSPTPDPLNTTAANINVAFTVNGASSIPAGTTCTVNGTSTTSTTTNNVALAMGSNTITASCTNAFGTGSDTTVVVRGTAPTVSITDPSTDPLNTTASTYDIAYTSTGTAPVTCTVTNTSTGATGDPVTLQVGTNNISVTCTNAFGSATDTTVIVRGTAPTVTITDPATDPVGTSNATYDIVYTSTGTAPVTCTVLNVTTGVTGDPVSLNAGGNLIRVTCTNAFGTAQDETTINRSSTPPTATITTFAEPSSGAGGGGASGTSGGATLTATAGLAAGSSAATGFECQLVGVTTWGACTTSSPTSATYAPPTGTLSNGNTYRYEIRAVNGGTQGPAVGGSFYWDSRTWTATPSVTALPNSITPAGQETQAGRHPNVQATISLVGWDDPATLTAKFPDGLMGSLSAVPAANRCTITQANAGTCPASSRIGTMSGVGVSSRDGSVTASGFIYLVRPQDVPSQYAAGVAVNLTADNPASQDLGNIRAVGYIGIRNELQAGTPSRTYDGARNMFLTIPNIPNTTYTGTGTETRASARRYHITSASVTVDGTVGSTSNPATNRPLVTNPHYCGTQFPAGNWNRPDQKRFLGSGSGYLGSVTANVAAPYTVTCTTQAFNPTFSFQIKEVADSTWTNTKPHSTQVMARAVFSVPDEALTVPNATIARAAVQMPPSVAADFPNIGSANEMCGTSSAYPSVSFAGYTTFFPGTNPADTTTYCPPSSIIGTAYIRTPLLPDEVIGRVYAINAAVPHLGIWIDPSVAPTNPQGVSFGLFARTDAGAIANEGDGFIQTIQLNLNSIPDVPVTRLEMIIGDNPARGPKSGGGTFDPTLLTTVSSTDTGCRPSPADEANGLPEYPDPWNVVPRFRPYSNIASVTDMTSVIFAAAGDFAPAGPKDVELPRIPIPITNCDPHF